MKESAGKQIKKVYIRSRNAEKLEVFCQENNLSLTDAVNTMIDDYFIKEGEKKTAPHLTKIMRQLEFLNLILQPSLLELLEVSGQLRWLTNDKPKATATGQEVRKEFESLYKEFLELKKHDH